MILLKYLLNAMTRFEIMYPKTRWSICWKTATITVKLNKVHIPVNCGFVEFIETYGGKHEISR